MIPISIPQKEVVKIFFENDIKNIKKYYNGISFDFDEEFRFDVFKEFIYAAAGMFKDLDMAVYNKELVGKFQSIRYLTEQHNDFLQRSLYPVTIFKEKFLHAQEAYMHELSEFELKKAAVQGMISREKSLTSQREQMEIQFADTHNPIANRESFEQELKQVRKEQVDTIHAIGTSRHELNALHEKLKNFEEHHREEFLKYFIEAKEKLMHQYMASLDYYGYEFNEALFRNSENSEDIRKFKVNAGIQGSLNLCKYLEYYLRNIAPEALADAVHKERLLYAKRYCERIGKN